MTNKLNITINYPIINSKILSILALSMALIAVSFAAIFIRLSEQEISANATIFNRLWIATLVFGLWNGIQDLSSESYSIPPVKPLLSWHREYLLLILLGCVASASGLCWAWSLTQTSIANSTLLRNLSPPFTILGGWLFFNQRFDRQFLMAMVLAILGISILGWNDLHFSKEHFIGDEIALLAAFFRAANLLLVEHLRGKLDTSTILLWRSGVGTVFLLPIILITQEQIFPNSANTWLAIIALTLICQIFGQGLLVYSLKHLSSGFVSLFLLLQPILTACLAWLIFAENLSLFNGFAFCLVLIGIYLAKSSQSIDKLKIN
jgi:drug/metabolite transporter (DMT)-like permease